MSLSPLSLCRTLRCSIVVDKIYLFLFWLLYCFVGKQPEEACERSPWLLYWGMCIVCWKDLTFNFCLWRYLICVKIFELTSLQVYGSFKNVIGADYGYFRISHAWRQRYRYSTYCNACSQWSTNNCFLFWLAFSFLTCSNICYSKSKKIRHIWSDG